jgi:hypothetical protein
MEEGLKDLKKYKCKKRHRAYDASKHVGEIVSSITCEVVFRELEE